MGAKKIIASILSKNGAHAAKSILVSVWVMGEKIYAVHTSLLYHTLDTIMYRGNKQ